MQATDKTLGSHKAGVRTLENLNRSINSNTGAVNRYQTKIELINALVEEKENEMVQLLIQSITSRGTPDIIARASELHTEIVKAKSERHRVKLDV